MLMVSMVLFVILEGSSITVQLLRCGQSCISMYSASDPGRFQISSDHTSLFVTRVAVRESVNSNRNAVA